VIVCLLAGGGVALVAVAGLHGPAHTNLAAHMAQHVLLLNVAAPLLALGTAVPRPLARLRPVTALVVGLVVQSGVMLAWHAPAPYRAAVRNNALHAVEHLAFLGAAMVFWWAVIAACRRAEYGASVLAVFFAMAPATILGFGLTFSRTAWYGGAVSDQQVAGVVMWSFGGLASIVAGLTLFVLWVRPRPRLALG
jgi:putative membrane protein